MATVTKFIFIFISIILLTLNQVKTQTTTTQTAEEIAKEYQINKDFCGYLPPSKNSDCYDKSTSKSQCCVITWNGKKACLPQSSSYFKEKRADFTIDNSAGSIMCGVVGEALGLTGLSTFFGSSYCGQRNSPLVSTDCKPVGLETNCCYLESKVQTTKEGIRTLRACINEVRTFNETVVAQTLFPGSNTTLSCYGTEAFAFTQVITTTSSNFVKLSIGLLSLIILYMI